MIILAWILFGLLIGVVTDLIDPHPSSGGIGGTILLGILGAVIGGFLGNMVFGLGITGFNFASFSVAVLGALLLLFVARSFGSA